MHICHAILWLVAGLLHPRRLIGRQEKARRSCRRAVAFPRTERWWLLLVDSTPVRSSGSFSEKPFGIRSAIVEALAPANHNHTYQERALPPRRPLRMRAEKVPGQGVPCRGRSHGGAQQNQPV